MKHTGMGQALTKEYAAYQTQKKIELICGLEWEAIQRAQRGGQLHDRISGPVVKQQATDDDRLALAMYGLEGLQAKGLHGVIDRLQTSGLI